MTRIDIVLRMRGPGWGAERTVQLPAVPRRGDEFAVVDTVLRRGPGDPRARMGWVAMPVTRVRWYPPEVVDFVEVTLDAGMFDPTGLPKEWDLHWD